MYSIVRIAYMYVYILYTYILHTQSHLGSSLHLQVILDLVAIATVTDTVSCSLDLLLVLIPPSPPIYTAITLPWVL